MKSLLMLGDSLIEWGNWHSYYADIEVYNQGWAGETVQGLENRLPGVIDRIDDTDGIILMTGTNNLAMDDFFFLPVYENIISSLQNKFSKAPILVTSLLPVNLPWIPASAIPNLNTQLMSLTQKMSILYLDLYSLFLTDAGVRNPACFSEDGVHLSDYGYQVWANAMSEVFPWLK